MNQPAANKILETFYHRMLPMFTPQAERFLDNVSPEDISHSAFRYTFSVEAMVKISRIIENAIISSPRTADAHISFQYTSRLLPQKHVYKQVARASNGLWIYGALDHEPDPLFEMAQVHLIDTADTFLMRYWFVVAYGPGIGMSLLAEEIPSLYGNERYYEGFFTFEPEVAYQLLAILHQTYPNDVKLPISPEMMQVV